MKVEYTNISIKGQGGLVLPCHLFYKDYYVLKRNDII